MLSAPSTTPSGSAFSFGLTVQNPQNPSNRTDISYVGTVHFTSTDSGAVLPADFTFAPANQGVSTFSATMNTAGAQAITATDSSNAVIVGISNSISVTSQLASNVISFTVNASASAGARQ